MKRSHLFIVTCMSIALLTSCSKNRDNTPDTTQSIEGVWAGTYVNEASGNSFFYSFNIKPGGVIQELNASGEAIGQGTWKLESEILTAQYQWTSGGKFSIIGAFYKHQGKILGNWGYGSSATNGGTWEMLRK